MKKKSYVAPQIRCVQMRRTPTICNGSPLRYRITSKRRQELLEMEMELDYAGIDTNGILDPD